MAVVEVSVGAPSGVAKPMLGDRPPSWVVGVLAVIIVVPFLALLAAVPFAWGWGVPWLDLSIGLMFYLVSGFGVTVGFHRHFTHGSFKAVRWLRVALAVAGSLALEGPVVQWVARHHAYADLEGDPHSPWRYGTTVAGLAKGLFFAHCGWLFQRRPSNPTRFAADLLADRGARHDVLRGQLDPSARLIWLLEKAGWVYDVRWLVLPRIDARHRQISAGSAGVSAHG
jgi:stearoyl-CoA desaturase (Delta-9 desaturase)